MVENNLVFNKAFMGQTSCFKIQLTKKGECYMHTGKKEGEKWQWKKAKFPDHEIADLMTFLSSEEKTVSFFHNYDNKQNQIYFNRNSYKGKIVISPIIDKLPGKSLAKGEQTVLKVLLQQIIARMNIE